MQLTRLTYVYERDPGPLGQLIKEIGGVLRFGEGSGLLELNDLAQRSQSAPPNTSPAGAPVSASSPISGSFTLPSGPPGPGDVSVRVMAVAFSQLPTETRAAIGEENVPCILGHSGTGSVLLLPPRSVARLNGGVSDLRGKIRYALARVDWTL